MMEEQAGRGEGVGDKGRRGSLEVEIEDLDGEGGKARVDREAAVARCAISDEPDGKSREERGIYPRNHSRVCRKERIERRADAKGGNAGETSQRQTVCQKFAPGERADGGEADESEGGPDEACAAFGWHGLQYPDQGEGDDNAIGFKYRAETH